uniref:Uncharacterized protein n=2 Tax=Cryptomonas curvata TaxID=233186 RepID=A0A7S0MBH2_9CRYP|mmetsp:Transcript_32486/g.67865  ORF Transcript_32486/g.67865 Transcript_32486/m.67865 type:complete len:165 (+) Transcript_32486:235-729(+)
MASHLDQIAATMDGAARKRAALDKFKGDEWKSQQGALVEDDGRSMPTAKDQSQVRVKLRASERVAGDEHDFSGNQDRAERRHVSTARVSPDSPREPLRDKAREYMLDRQRSLESGKGLSAGEELRKALASLGQFGGMFSHEQIDRAFRTVERLEEDLLGTDHSA